MPESSMPTLMSTRISFARIVPLGRGRLPFVGRSGRFAARAFPIHSADVDTPSDCWRSGQKVQFMVTLDRISKRFPKNYMLDLPGLGGFLHALQSITASPFALLHFAVVIFEHLPLTQQLTFSSFAIAEGAATMKAARINSANTFFICETSFK
jgi:hypothetical protein